MRHCLTSVKTLYENSLKEHGTTSKGVGWSSTESHAMRFDQLLKVIKDPGPVTINDLGCGYGALLTYLCEKKTTLGISHYTGYDISEEMLSKAKSLLFHRPLYQPFVEWIHGDQMIQLADYSFASGIFNVKFQEETSNWIEYILATLKNLSEYSARGFAFNLLSSYVDYRVDHLYYGDPCFYFDFCKKNFSKNVTLLHDYSLWEWTITVNKG